MKALMCMEKHCKFMAGQKRRNQTMALEAKVQMATVTVLSPEARTNFADNHDISKCYKLKNKEKRNGTYKTKGQFDEEGKASIAANDSSSDGDILIAFAGCASSGDEWILDTAASFHIC